MERRTRFAMAMICSLALFAGTAQAAEPPEPSARFVDDLHLSFPEAPGEMSVRLPLAAEGRLIHGLLGPYLSLGSTVALGAPWTSTPAAGLRGGGEGLEDLRLGAGMAMPISDRIQLYGEYRFLGGRLDGGAGRGLLRRDSDATDFRAGFFIRLR